MREYTLFGSSRSTISMLLETLYRVHPEALRVTIVENVESSDELPYDIPGVVSRRVPHDAWDPDDAGPACCMLGVTRPHVKRLVADFWAARGIHADRYAHLTHPTAELAATVTAGAGTHIGPGTIIAPHTHLGEHVTLNRGVTVGHHTELGAFATVNPGVNIAGRCRIAAGVTIGMGANVLDGVQIGADVVVGAGALVTRDVEAGVVVYGVPARVVRSVS